MAGENAAEVATNARIEFREGVSYVPVAPGERFDVIVSNPPYIAEPEAASLQPEVGAWEPAAALFGGPDGLVVVRELVDGAAAHLEAGGLLALEIGAGQAGPVVAAVESTGKYGDVRVRRDLAGRERVVLARMPADPTT